MFTIEMFPAGHGDCLWIEYGDPARPTRILIDGGTAATFKALHRRLDAMVPEDRHFELFVVTHVDADHIEGAVRLLHDTSLGVQFDDIWFNGWEQLLAATDETLGGVQGEMLTGLIERDGRPHNGAFDGGPVLVPEEGPLPVVTLAGGMKLTLLSPDRPRLSKLRAAWTRELAKAGLAPGDADAALEKLEKTKKLHGLTLGDERVSVKDLARTKFDPDGAPANGSSIAFLAEYEGSRALLTGDAFATVLAPAVDRLLRDRGDEALKVDACKLSHHGSASNTNLELLKLLRCKRWLFSTNGDYFEHPDDEAVARVITAGGRTPELLFNYRSPRTEPWADADLRDKHDYDVVYPDDPEGGLKVEL